MTDPATARLDVEALYARLCERLAALSPRVVGAVLEAFLEVSLLRCELRLWSLEFAFDEDDGRIARLEARFADPTARGPIVEAIHGYEVQMLLPRVLPPRPPGDGAASSEGATAAGGGGNSDALLARFERALAELGAYRTIETIELVSAEVYLL